jgi:hypothetical protein
MRSSRCDSPSSSTCNARTSAGAQDEKHRIRQADPPCEDIQRSDDHQQKADELYLSHMLTKKDFPLLGKRGTC